MALPDFLAELFSSRFMPHGHCYLWTPGLVWLHAASDALVALSYTSIPFTLFVFSRRRRDLPFNWMFLLFATFIVACGLTHYMEVWTLWNGTYWLSGAIKAVTALASVPTAILLVRLVPRALAIPHPAALRASEARFRVALDGSLDAFFLLQSAGETYVVVDTNARGERLCGRERPAMVGQKIDELLPDKLRRVVLERYDYACATGKTVSEEFELDGQTWWEHQLVPIADGLAVTLRDITPRKAAERALRDSEARIRALLETAIRESSERDLAEKARARLAAIVESTDYAVYSRSLDGTIESWNAGAEKLYGYLPSEIVGKPASLLVPRHVADELAPMRAETIRMRKDGSVVEVHLNVSSIKDCGNHVGHAVIARDITEQKTAERQLKSSLREKEVLLKEVHHRVKNNLQVISSLLNLQAANISDPKALEMFRESQDRVRSIAFFHEHLYQSEDLARVDVGAYLRTLAQNLVASYAASRALVTTSVHADEDVRLGVDKAIPCGLIVNELVTNALKHGFRDGQAGNIAVDLRATSGRDLVLEVVDDGVGLPPGYNVGTAGTLGHQLVLTLVKQLDGRLDVASDRGARFEITFGRQVSGDHRAIDHHR